MENAQITTQQPSDAADETAVHNNDASSGAQSRRLDIVSLYPKDMNIYGDYGNVLTVSRRAALYGYEPVVHQYNQGDQWPEHVDIVLGGGGQDNGQKKIVDDLFERADTLRDLARQGVPMLMICGMYQLFGQYFETIDGTRLEGIGIMGVHTVGQDVRMIGNLTETSEEFDKIIGYENHSGQTFLHEGTEPLGRVEFDGTGNNGEDHTEGARVHNVIGTYMHGSLLPKNPKIADFLIRTAAERRYGVFEPIQNDQMRNELARIDRIADRARAVAKNRPR
ncbi:type 1 glutamine amidotransferase [Bifidobacterium tsurumiense]|uniref:Lipid II isoglutaminyl synthase (glutamine-hydrolyzing) subunit GatD n=1 Tax=Bifidobacterium tsurumiense TaxID=356829 RepID=A0A087E919_9BIFI|nr:glutamine amidotransferase [Bifidobacterium tsurumiense]KFJ04270.1 cobyric acid synthase CobQ [Bifidobacterium tsurumiense]MDY4678588.1 glutamine amidotransferase [Bifidobacterium tsurumiense]MSS12594.1 glutamine amidotransferase [Bifidobacterium tsurumiense]